MFPEKGIPPDEALVRLEVPGEADKYIKAWKLKTVLEHVKFPPGVEKRNLRYLFSLIYPKKIRYDEDEQTIAVYHSLLNKEIDRFPRNFLSKKADTKLCLMLKDYINMHIQVCSLYELYDMFKDPVYGNKLLKEARLFSAYRDIYTSPLEFLHVMLIGTEQAVPALYNIDSFMCAFGTASREMKKNKKRLKSP